MSQMVRVEFPEIELTLPKAKMEDGRPVIDKDGQPVLEVDEKGQLVREDIKAEQLHLMAVARAGGLCPYEGFRLHLSISAAIENAKDGFVLLDDKQWEADTKALEAFTGWPWFHDDVVKVIDTARAAKKVDVKVDEEAPELPQ